MRQKLMIFLFLLLVASLVSRDAPSASSSSLGFLLGRRATREWSSSSHSQKEFAAPGEKPTDQETENTSNTESEDIFFNIDYHGATTHPTPTPRHPTP